MSKENTKIIAPRLKPFRILLYMVIIVVVAYGGLTLYAWKYFRIQFTDFRGLVEMAQVAVSLGEAMRTGQLPHRVADYNSVGFPQKEERLRRLGENVEDFGRHLGRLPTRIAELKGLVEFHPENKARIVEESKEFDQSCQILGLSKDSYILNCDGWAAPGRQGVRQLVSTFQPGVERFYAVNGHVLLYVPEPIPGKSLPQTKGSDNRYER